MDGKDIEKNLYELLGVKVFRKALFSYEKVIKKTNLYSGYRIEGSSVMSLENYKSVAKRFTRAHVLGLLITVPYFVATNSTTGVVLASWLNLSCIMTQRYNVIRINEVIEKYNQILKKREQRRQLKECETFPKINCSYELVNNKLSSKTTTWDYQKQSNEDNSFQKVKGL